MINSCLRLSIVGVIYLFNVPFQLYEIWSLWLECGGSTNRNIQEKNNQLYIFVRHIHTGNWYMLGYTELKKKDVVTETYRFNALHITLSYFYDFVFKKYQDLWILCWLNFNVNLLPFCQFFFNFTLFVNKYTTRALFTYQRLLSFGSCLSHDL